MGNCAMNKEERTIVSDDHKYWDALGRPMDWELIGFTHQLRATYRTPGDGSIQITHNQMEQINAAIKNAMCQMPFAD